MPAREVKRNCAARFLKKGRDAIHASGPRTSSLRRYLGEKIHHRPHTRRPQQITVHDQPEGKRANLFGWHELHQVWIAIRRETGQDRGADAGLAGRVLNVARIGSEYDWRIPGMFFEPVAAAKSVFFGPGNDVDIR